MKIGFYSPTLSNGGYEKVIISFANELVSRFGCQVSIVCGNATGELRDSISSDIRIIDLKCRTKTLLPKMIRFFKNCDLDIWYSGFRIYNCISVIAKKISHNEKLCICGSQHGYEKSEKLLSILFGKVMSEADLHISVTNSLMVYEKDKLKLSCPCTVVHNPVISKQSFMNLEPDVCKRYTLATCGRLSKDKNTRLALLILKELISSGINANLLIIGNGPEEQNLKAEAESLHISENVFFSGFVPNPIAYLQQCAVYLHTCDLEGFGNTVVEAMFAGLPVITTDCGGPVDIIERNRYGICFGSGYGDDAAVRGKNAVIHVLDNLENYNKQQEKALQFDAEVVTSKLLQEFNKLL